MPNKAKSEAPNIYFTTTDPQGREITLTESTWQHIQEKHPEIKGVSEVKSTINKPDIISEITHRQSIAYTKIADLNLYVNVFVKVDDTYTEGNVKTSYLTRQIPSGGVIWSKSS